MDLLLGYRFRELVSEWIFIQGYLIYRSKVQYFIVKHFCL